MLLSNLVGPRVCPRVLFCFFTAICTYRTVHGHILVLLMVYLLTVISSHEMCFMHGVIEEDRPGNRAQRKRNKRRDESPERARNGKESVGKLRGPRRSESTHAAKTKSAYSRMPAVCTARRAKRPAAAHLEDSRACQGTMSTEVKHSLWPVRRGQVGMSPHQLGTRIPESGRKGKAARVWGIFGVQDS